MIKKITISGVLLAASLGTAAMAQDRGVDPESRIDRDTEFRLAPGFKATMYGDSNGYARHITTRPDGTVYVALRRSRDGKGIVAMKDSDGDGYADVQKRFGDEMGTGIEFKDGKLYFASTTEVYIYDFKGDEMVPSGEPKVLISGFIKQRSHASKPFTFDDEGHIYVNIGAPSNACQIKPRSKGSSGVPNCPQLDLQAGIWQFDANKLGQVHGTDGVRYSTGIRNAMGLDWNHDNNSLYFNTHGRDSLSDLWGYSDEDSQELPSEEFHKAEMGSDHGWPYTYWDHRQEKRVKSPEYGGKGMDDFYTGDKYRDPVVGFPAHWAPNDLLFVKGDNLPDYFKGGAFSVFHGSWNRAPSNQKGYNIQFVPFKDGKPAGEPIMFADGFPNNWELKNPSNAKHRPMGMAEGSDGALYVTSSLSGKVWRITYEGK